MKLSTILLSVLLGCSALAVERSYQTGKILDVEQKVNTEVLYYIVNTPITRDAPYYEVSVQVKDVVYVGQYTPRHSADTLPAGWEAGTEVQARVQNKTMFLKVPEGRELSLPVIKHFIAKPQPASNL